SASRIERGQAVHGACEVLLRGPSRADIHLTVRRFISAIYRNSPIKYYTAYQKYMKRPGRPLHAAY
ncbi:MAG: hypothetical protein M0R03_21350, partial [Novosphingobium sp.]|nr:hypothetical protein [Novosphingobium sp.]